MGTGPTAEACACSVALKPNVKPWSLVLRDARFFFFLGILDGYELARASAASMRLFANSRPPGYITFSLVLGISNQRPLSRLDQKVFRKQDSSLTDTLGLDAGGGYCWRAAPWFRSIGCLRESAAAVNR